MLKCLFFGIVAGMGLAGPSTKLHSGRQERNDALQIRADWPEVVGSVTGYTQLVQRPHAPGFYGSSDGGLSISGAFAYRCLCERILLCMHVCTARFWGSSM